MNYAFIKNNEVVNIVLFDNPDDAMLELFKNEHELDEIIECTGNNRAVMGSSYLEGIFIRPKPFESWILDSDNNWKAPTPMPVVEGKVYAWSEDVLSWIELEF
jgi:hypothetical protein